MNKENMKRDSKKSPDKKASKQINIRVTPKASEFMKENNYSPTGIFLEALKEVGFKQ